MDEVIGRDVILADIKLLTEADVQDLVSDMTWVEQARFKERLPSPGCHEPAKLSAGDGCRGRRFSG
jgi:hypothetical protein